VRAGRFQDKLRVCPQTNSADGIGAGETTDHLQLEAMRIVLSHFKYLVSPPLIFSELTLNGLVYDDATTTLAQGGPGGLL